MSVAFLYSYLTGSGSANLTGGGFLLPIIGVAAFVDSVNPCAISVLLLMVAFLFSMEHSRSKIIRIGGLYIFGVFLTYILIGLGILQTLTFFGAPRFMAKAGAIVIILAGAINLLGTIFHSFPIKLKIPKTAHPRIARLIGKGTAPAIFLLGVLVGLFEFPCTGGPYLMVLGLLHDKATFVKGFLYLLFYNAIFILPLIIILIIASNQKLLQKIQTLKSKGCGKIMNIWGSLIMISLGAIIYML